MYDVNIVNDASKPFSGTANAIREPNCAPTTAPKPKSKETL